MSEESDARDELWKRWYVYRMNFCKPRIKPQTKVRMLHQLEDAVLKYADLIRGRRNSG